MHNTKKEKKSLFNFLTLNVRGVIQKKLDVDCNKKFRKYR